MGMESDGKDKRIENFMQGSRVEDARRHEEHV
jgi:hypothetical protein